MKAINLNIAQISKNKFAIVAGKSILAKFKTVDLAKKSLEEKRELYEYWAGSVSVSVQNTKPFIVLC